MIIRNIFLVLALSMMSSVVLAAADTTSIPDDLAKWKPWVLHGQEDKLCTSCYNNAEKRVCVWPSRLDLKIGQEVGSFTQSWAVENKTWVVLPGNTETWPVDVKVNGKAISAAERSGRPYLFLDPGKYTVEGVFRWKAIPETISVPAESGVVSVTIKGNRIDHPYISQDGQLWLQKSEKGAEVEDVLELKAFRLVDDMIPQRMTTHLKLNVSGKPREIHVSDVLLAGYVPMEIKSQLPVRIESDGQTVIQARSGRWEIEVLARSQGPVHRIGPVKTIGSQEIWSFQSRNHLRIVDIQSVHAIDPKQTDVPWKELSAYIVGKGATVVFKEVKRGDPEPAPDQLVIDRTMWLDMDGKGYTVKDAITGTMSSQWYLTMNPSSTLGHVSIDGEDMLITAQGKDKRPGVEIRRGMLNMAAESRIEKARGQFQAVGWDHDFQTVTGRINMPPGYEVLTALGVDKCPGTWTDRWDLYDFFLVIIIGLAALKIWGRGVGILAFVVMVLIYQEPGAPRFVWLHVLASTALLQVISKRYEKIVKAVGVWRLVSFVALLIISLPFVVNQVRTGLYPQLDVPDYMLMARPQMGMQEKAAAPALEAPVEEQATDRMSSVMVSKAPLGKGRAYERTKPEQKAYTQDSNMAQNDPNALVQTGPGLPTWNFRQYQLQWSGPVKANQAVRLIYLTPFMSMVMSFSQVILLALLVLLVVPVKQAMKSLEGKLKGAAAAAVMLLSMLPTVPANAGEFPPQDLLDRLQARMLEQHECYPDCASAESARLSVRDKVLKIGCRVSAVIDSAIPLPGSSNGWKPSAVVVDGKKASGLVRDEEGVLWTLVGKGAHTIEMSGPVPPVDTLDILMPLKPHLVTVDAAGWEVRGVDKDGRTQGSVQLVKQVKTEEKGQKVVQLPPFLSLERQLLIGLEWRVVNTLRRVTPVGTPVVVFIPLIEGEAVTTQGIRVEKGNAVIDLAPDATEISWVSSLKQRGTVNLTAPKDVPWTEEWIIDASPVWHATFSGIPVVHHRNPEGRWMPRWSPWPGESVTISISRPEAIPGQTVTVDMVNLTYKPGQRINKAVLGLSIKCAQGAQHTVMLPRDMSLERVRIDGTEHP